jgi:c(7)-type cytochrome triheme protein
MRYLIAFIAAFTLIGGLVAVAQTKTPPAKVVFEAKTGNVTYDHAAHAKREKNDCKVCHDKLFQQAKAPINYKPAMHKTAEANKTACGFCHRPGGPAFETKGNCANSKCHVKGAAKG